jgi:putative acid phosphatase of HAD superfamily subfamily IIIB
MRPRAPWKRSRPAPRRRPILRYALAVAAVAALTGAVALAVASPGLWHTSNSNGTPVYSVRPTGVGLPLVGAEGTVGAGDYASALKTYHDSGDYDDDLEAVDARARAFLGQRVSALRQAGSGAKPALVLDIDETSLSNYQYISATNFTEILAGLALGVAAANDPPIQPTLDLFRFARSKGVAVFFITGRPGNIPQTRSRTVTNLESAGYAHWAGLSLNPGGLETVPYKSGERAKIEQRGYRIVANVGDQESDLQGGHADRAFKLPNPFYFIGP